MGLVEGSYNKFLLFAGLQHFERDDFSDLIDIIKIYAEKEFTVLLGFVPDLDKRPDFYKKFTKKVKFSWLRLRGKNVFGTWWKKSWILGECKSKGLNCRVVELPESSYGYPYRFHVVLTTCSSHR